MKTKKRLKKNPYICSCGFIAQTKEELLIHKTMRIEPINSRGLSPTTHK